MTKVVMTAEQIAEYQRLLVADWKKDLPEAVLELLWSAIRPEQTNGNEGVVAWLGSKGDRQPSGNFADEILRHIRDAKHLISATGLPALPPSYNSSKRMSKTEWQALRLSAYMILPACMPFSGSVVAFRDARSLAFHAAVQFVLPAVREKHSDLHAILLNACFLFPLEYLESDPSHYCFLLGSIHEYLGNQDQRLFLLHSAFRFTPPTDHSFLTKAQAYWSELIDRGRNAEAEEFLFSLHLSALPEQRDEVREMMGDALRYMIQSDPQPAV